MTTKDGLPAVKPPWSTLTAYDMKTGKIKWQIPLGGLPELEARGIKDTGGYFPQGGPAVTAGGLVFSGVESDSTMRAYDKDSGKVLWEHEMPGAPHAEVAVYQVHGREYVVQAALPKPAGPGSGPVPPEAEQAQGYYVFALPEKGAARAGDKKPQ
jgi:quinoprotein glucose dehydrogenase